MILKVEYYEVNMLKSCSHHTNLICFIDNLHPLTSNVNGHGYYKCFWKAQKAQATPSNPNVDQR